MKELVCSMDREGGVLQVRAPAPGIWTHSPQEGESMSPSDSMGTLTILGRRVRLRLPATASGRVIDTARQGAVRATPVEFAQVLVRLDPQATLAVHADGDETAADASSTELQMNSPASGRFWLRPSPSDEPFVTTGQVIGDGDPIGLLEVMKTFTRISYGGPSLPSRARVVRVVPADGDDVEAGAVLLELERDC